MIYRPFTAPVGDPAWDRWSSRADKRTKALLAKFDAREKYTISQELYKEMRQVFLDAFHGKCAYCEAKIILDQHQGDVEHYRPKGRVTDEAGNAVMTPGPGGELEEHRGYPWLAYDWHNLLPSCKACNQPGRTRQGSTVGKWDKFPVGRFRATIPDEVRRERPRLLNPSVDKPEDHLRLDPERGIVGWRTERGRVTVELLGLNREGLPEERREIYLKVKTFVDAARDHLDKGKPELAREYIESLQKYRDGSQAWSWAGRLALAAMGSPRLADG